MIMTKIVLISDTHGYWDAVDVPAGDIVIHAGDFGLRGKLGEVPYFAEWFNALPHKHKIFVAGNHDWCFEQEREKAEAELSGVTYLQDSSVIVEGLKIYGSPWQPRFFDWAFNVDRGEKIAKIWQKIPTDTDVLVTHGPPFGILDRCQDGRIVGCEDLKARVLEIKPKLHVFGHIHESYGIITENETTYVNASICNIRYTPTNQPIVFDI
jgi:Icc-related predicted phosphoesterase